MSHFIHGPNEPHRVEPVEGAQKPQDETGRPPEVEAANLGKAALVLYYIRKAFDFFLEKASGPRLRTNEIKSHLNLLSAGLSTLKTQNLSMDAEFLQILSGAVQRLVDDAPYTKAGPHKILLERLIDSFKKNLSVERRLLFFTPENVRQIFEENRQNPENSLLVLWLNLAKEIMSLLQSE